VKRFPDIEDALIEVLDDLGPAGTSTAPDVDAFPIRVNRVSPGGASQQGLFDTASVTVTAFKGTRDESKHLNQLIRARLTARRLVATGAGMLDSINEDLAPIPEFDPNPDVRKVVSRWTVRARLQELPEPVAP
jgi:hypothetical protein